MKFVEVRRHSLRDEKGSLSPEGIALAHKAAGGLAKKYAACYSGPALRCRQTLEAMGFKEYAVDEGFDSLPGKRLRPYMPDVERTLAEKGWGLLQALLEHPEAKEVLQEAGDRVLQAVKRLARDLPEGGRALVVSHGGCIEPAALLALGNFDLSVIGGELKECEGVVFELAGDEVVGVEVVRL